MSKPQSPPESRKGRGIAFAATIIVAIAIAIFAIFGLLTWQMTGSLQVMLVDAAIARQELELTEQLQLGVLTAESAQRAYLLTGQPTALQPSYDAGLATANHALDTLDDLARRDPRLRADLPSLRDAIQRKTAELQRVLSIYQTQGPAAATAMVETEAGRSAMQLVAHAVATISERAVVLRTGYFRDLSDRQTQIGVAALLAGAIGVGLLCFAALRQLVARVRLSRLQVLLQQQSERLQSTVDHIRDGVAVFDQNGRLLLWNALFFPISRLPTSLAIQGTTIDAFVAASAEWPEPCLAEPQPPLGEPISRELKCPDQVVELWRSTLPDGGQMIAVADITRRTQAEAIAAQAQKMEALGHLTGGIAHDFNNLLQVISGSLELIGKRLPRDQGEHQDLLARLATAQASVERGASLTRHLLAFARRQPLAPVALDVSALMVGMQEMLQRTLGAAIYIEIVVPKGLWPIQADARQLEHAVLNLAINARDAMPAGGRLTIEANNVALDSTYAAANADVAPGKYVVIAVSDTGIGMTPAQIARAVEPFYTTKPEGTGTGLGLSMVYGFARQSGGHFKLYSEVNHGTTARLYIPRSETAPMPVTVERTEVPRGAGELILMVEDDPSVRTTVSLALEELGYRVLVADGGASALSLLRNGARPDLLFADVVMPGAPTAPTLAAEAKRLVGNGLAVAFTSGYTENAIVHNGKLDPDVRLISKPWRLDELARFLRAALDSRPAPRRGRRILLVEDELLVSMTTADLLSDLGYDVAVAETGSEALRHLESDIDVLITDLGLPDMDGSALIAAARARQRGVAVVVATGRARQEAGGLGPLIWLNKPYDSEDLRQALGPSDERRSLMLHLCKLSVGVRDVAQLRERQAGSHSPYHQTRNFPRRHAEILAGGSIYWVISGVMQVRQQILDICQDQWDDGSACAKLVLSPELISVAGRHMRPFQGWRYLEKNDAPNDVSANDGIVGESALPEALRYDLRALCLL